MMNETCFAVEVDAALVRRFLMPCQPNRAATPRFRGEISWLTPFQRFIDRTDSFFCCCRLKNDFANGQQLMAKRFWILFKNLLYREVIKSLHFTSLLVQSREPLN